jgi:hypothetical protein
VINRISRGPSLDRNDLYGTIFSNIIYPFCKEINGKAMQQRLEEEWLKEILISSR